MAGINMTQAFQALGGAYTGMNQAKADNQRRIEWERLNMPDRGLQLPGDTNVYNNVQNQIAAWDIALKGLRNPGVVESYQANNAATLRNSTATSNYNAALNTARMPYIPNITSSEDATNKANIMTAVPNAQYRLDTLPTETANAIGRARLGIATDANKLSLLPGEHELAKSALAFDMKMQPGAQDLAWNEQRANSLKQPVTIATQFNESQTALLKAQAAFSNTPLMIENGIKAAVAVGLTTDAEIAHLRKDANLLTQPVKIAELPLWLQEIIKPYVNLEWVETIAIGELLQYLGVYNQTQTIRTLDDTHNSNAQNLNSQQILNDAPPVDAYGNPAMTTVPVNPFAGSKPTYAPGETVPMTVAVGGKLRDTSGTVDPTFGTDVFPVPLDDTSAMQNDERIYAPEGVAPIYSTQDTEAATRVSEHSNAWNNNDSSIVPAQVLTEKAALDLLIAKTGGYSGKFPMQDNSGTLVTDFTGRQLYDNPKLDREQNQSIGAAINAQVYGWDWVENAKTGGYDMKQRDVVAGKWYADNATLNGSLNTPPIPEKKTDLAYAQDVKIIPYVPKPNKLVDVSGIDMTPEIARNYVDVVQNNNVNGGAEYLGIDPQVATVLANQVGNVKDAMRFLRVLIPSNPTDKPAMYFDTNNVAHAVTDIYGNPLTAIDKTMPLKQLNFYTRSMFDAVNDLGGKSLQFIVMATEAQRYTDIQKHNDKVNVLQHRRDHNAFVDQLRTVRFNASGDPILPNEKSAYSDPLLKEYFEDRTTNNTNSRIINNIVQSPLTSPAVITANQKEMAATRDNELKTVYVMNYITRQSEPITIKGANGQETLLQVRAKDVAKVTQFYMNDSTVRHGQEVNMRLGEAKQLAINANIQLEERKYITSTEFKKLAQELDVAEFNYERAHNADILADRRAARSVRVTNSVSKSASMMYADAGMVQQLITSNQKKLAAITITNSVTGKFMGYDNETRAAELIKQGEIYDNAYEAIGGDIITLVNTHLKSQTPPPNFNSGNGKPTSFPAHNGTKPASELIPLGNGDSAWVWLMADGSLAGKTVKGQEDITSTDNGANWEILDGGGNSGGNNSDGSRGDGGGSGRPVHSSADSQKSNNIDEEISRDAIDGVFAGQSANKPLSDRIGEMITYADRAGWSGKQGTSVNTFTNYVKSVIDKVGFTQGLNDELSKYIYNTDGYHADVSKMLLSKPDLKKALLTNTVDVATELYFMARDEYQLWLKLATVKLVGSGKDIVKLIDQYGVGYVNDLIAASLALGRTKKQYPELALKSSSTTPANVDDKTAASLARDSAIQHYPERAR